MSDHFSRKWALVISTIILFMFAALSAGSYGGGSINGMLSALTAWRFLLGIGIGLGPPPTRSVQQLMALQWRISSRQRCVCRKYRRTQGRSWEQMVHHVHKRPDRHWIRHVELCAHDCSSGLRRQPSTSSMENMPRVRRNPAAQSNLPMSETGRA